MTLSPRLFALAVIFACLPEAASAQQQVPAPQSHLKVTWAQRCGGVDPDVLKQRRKEALEYALTRGVTAADFAKREQHCPKRDLEYYNAILATRRPA